MRSQEDDKAWSAVEAKFREMQAKLADREKRLKLARDEMLMAENFNQDSPSWKKYRDQALAACNLDIPLQKE